MSDTQHPAGQQRTTLTDIDIPFGRLVLILIKVGLAAIPAAIVLSIVFMLVGALLAAIFGSHSFFFMMGRPGGGQGI